MAAIEQSLNRIFVGNLTDGVTKAHLEAEFNKFGEVTSIFLALKPSGFAFIDYKTQEECQKACDALNGTHTLNSSNLKVEILQPRSTYVDVL